MFTKDKFNILLGCTGSVASTEALDLVQRLKSIHIHNHTVEVQMVATKNALNFIHIKELQKWCKLHSDNKIQDTPSNLHIVLREWADLFVIAPLGANTLAKIANGLCNNLITHIAREWDFQKPILFCPAMNDHMWNHPITATHISELTAMGCIEVPCVSAYLACGEIGHGAMANISTVCDKLTKILHSMIQ